MKRYIPLVFTVLVLILLSIFVYDRYGANSTALQDQVERSERNQIESVENTIHADLDNIASDLILLANSREIKEYSLSDGEISTKEAENELQKFVRIKKIYVQARILDLEGKEAVRVDFNGQESTVKPKEGLQDKSDRYYFTDSVDLQVNQIYISPLDLNVEGDIVEIPYKPVIRLTTPIYHDDEKQGILVLNYLAQNLIDDFNNLSSSIDSNIELLNEDGYWLISESKEDEWGFMFEGKKSRNLEIKYPKIWERVKEDDSGQFYLDDELITYKKIRPIDEIYAKSDYRWIILSR